MAVGPQFPMDFTKFFADMKLPAVPDVEAPADHPLRRNTKRCARPRQSNLRLKTTRRPIACLRACLES